MPNLPNRARRLAVAANPELARQQEFVELPPLPKLAIKPHIWDGQERFSSNTDTTCRVCGVTCQTDSVIQADKRSLRYTYTDAYNVQIQSLTELGCPIFVGQVAGKVLAVEGQVKGVRTVLVEHDTRVSSVEERLLQLEQDNQQLRAQLQVAQTIDVTQILAWMQQFVGQDKQLPEFLDVEFESVAEKQGLLLGQDADSSSTE